MPEINAEIIVIGTEILLGDLTDTNSVFIARTLRDLGVNLYCITSVGDNEKRIAQAITGALSRAQLVITCGGLGPTIDDMTRQAVALATKRGLTFHPELLEQVVERFRMLRVPMTENNRRQAFVPDGAVIIENPVGTAPSFAVEQDDKIVVCLPGVPREMKYLLIEKVVPYLRLRLGLAGKIIKGKILKVAGIGESALDELIGQPLLERSNPTVGLAAHSGQIDVRIMAKADSPAEADALIAQTEAELRQNIGDYIFGVDGDSIEQALSRALLQQNSMLLIAEIGMEPIISSRFSQRQGDKILKASLHYSSVADMVLALGLSPTLALRELAEAAAKQLSQQYGARVVLLALSCSDALEDKADSSEICAVAVSVDGHVRSRTYGFSGGNDIAPEWMSSWSMSIAWRMLHGASTH